MRPNALISLLFLCLASSLLAQASPAPARGARCYLVMEEGSSDEGNSLYLQKMLIDPSLLKLFAPTRFKRAQGRIELISSGQFSYESEGPQLIARSKRLVVYAVDLRYSAPRAPKAAKTIVVDFKLAELSRGRDLVQPAERAIELAASKAGMASGLAYIASMEMPSPQSFRAKVELSP